MNDTNGIPVEVEPENVERVDSSRVGAPRLSFVGTDAVFGFANCSTLVRFVAAEREGLL